MDRQNYLTISAFSRLSGIKRKTLIYYDQIGLLPPKLVGDNGYRYYDYPQLYTVNMIHLFREINMPLEEIKNHLQNSTPEQAAVLLKRQQEVIREKQRYYDEMSVMVDRQLASLEEYASAEHLKCSVVTLEEVPLFFSSTIYKIPEFRASISLREVYQQGFSAGYNFIYPSGILMKAPSDIIENHSIKAAEVQYYIKVPEAEFSRPAGEYAICYYTGILSHDLIIKKMIDYLNEQHLKMQGNIYIDIILNGLSGHTFNDFLLKMLVRVIPCEKE